MRTISKVLNHRAFNNILWLALERAFQLFGGIYVSGVIARHFGVVLFGQWQYAQTIIVIAMALTWVCGAEVIVPKLASNISESESDVLGSALIIRLVASSFVTLGLYLSIPYIFKTHNTQIILLGMGFTVLIREPSMVAFAWFQSKTYSKPALVINIVSLLVKIILLTFLVKVNAKLVWFALAWAFESVLVGVLINYHFIKHYHPKISVSKAKLVELAKSSVFIWLGLVLMYALFRLDRVFLERYLSRESYGLYAAAAQLNENWIAIGAMLSQAISPMYIYNENDTVKLRRNFYKILTATIVATIFGSAFLSIFSPFIIHTIFGPAYISSGVLFVKIVWLSLIVNVEAILNSLVLKQNAGHWFSFKWLVGFLTALFSCIILVPSYGENGAILSMYFGVIVVMLTTIIFIRRTKSL